MKLKALTSGLLIVFLVGCSGTNHDSTVQPTPEQQGSEPSVTKPTATPIQPQALQTTKSQGTLAKSAQLTPKQVEYLRNIAGGDTIKFPIIIPTYVPAGFQPYIFKDENTPGPYVIAYRNASNACFSIYATVLPDASPEGFKNVKAVNSRAFGKINITYTDFNKTSSPALIAAQVRAFFRSYHKRNYGFNSPIDLIYIENNSQQFKDCTSISLIEGVKIVESLQFLDSEDLGNLLGSNSEF